MYFLTFFLITDPSFFADGLCEHRTAAVAGGEIDSESPPCNFRPNGASFWSAMGRSSGDTTATFLAGAAAGAVSRTATAPLDRLKIMRQVGAPVDGVLCLYRQGGLPALFLGNQANVIKSVPELGVKFMAFDTVTTMLQQRRSREPGHGGHGTCSMSERLLSGAVAGALSCIAIYPLEVAKTRMTLGNSAHHGLGSTLASIVRIEGPMALTQGLGASLAGIVPFCALDLALYSSSRDWVRRRSGGAEPSSSALLACGAFSSLCSTVATYPLALIRTLLQAGGSEGYVRYDGVVDCARRTVTEGGGVRALFRGLGPNLLKAVPSLSISYVVFENVKRLLAPATA